MLKEIILATNNKHKIEELTTMLTGTGITVRSLRDVANIPPVDEDQPTLEGNALKKARTVFHATNIPALADDSGLEVFYLNGWPGVYSARYAGEGCTFDDNNKKLLKELLGVPPRRRQAQFRSVLALVGSNYEKVVEGKIDGMITEEPRGKSGFGYDPVFQPIGFTKTFAEMNPEEKNSISHRGLALLKMKGILLNM